MSFFPNPLDPLIIIPRSLWNFKFIYCKVPFTPGLGSFVIAQTNTLISESLLSTLNKFQWVQHCLSSSKIQYNLKSILLPITEVLSVHTDKILQFLRCALTSLWIILHCLPPGPCWDWSLDTGLEVMRGMIFKEDQLFDASWPPQGKTQVLLMRDDWCS